MGIEQSVLQNSAPSVQDQPFNLGALDFIDQARADHKAQERLSCDPPAAKPQVRQGHQSGNKYEAAVAEQVTGLDSEAKFTQYSSDALARDADKYPPKRNQNDHSTIYTIEQFGLTDRGLPKDSHQADHYKRLVTITVPDRGRFSEGLSNFAYHRDRIKIDEQEFYTLIARSQKRQRDLTTGADEAHKLFRPDDMVINTQGIRTGAEAADFQALALQLTQGHGVIDVDWQSTPKAEEQLTLSEVYKSERKGAAQSYSKIEKGLDDTTSHIGAEHCDFIAFSHGAMFDSRYLQHRKDLQDPLLHTVIFTHPDVPISALPALDKNGRVEPAKRLYSCASKDTYVIGSSEDLALAAAAFNDCEPASGGSWLEQMLEKGNKMPLYERIGSGKKISRELVAGSGGTYVVETIPEDKQDPYKHFINFAGINSLINAPEAASGREATKGRENIAGN